MKCSCHILHQLGGTVNVKLLCCIVYNYWTWTDSTWFNHFKWIWLIVIWAIFGLYLKSVKHRICSKNFWPCTIEPPQIAFQKRAQFCFCLPRFPVRHCALHCQWRPAAAVAASAADAMKLKCCTRSLPVCDVIYWHSGRIPQRAQVFAHSHTHTNISTPNLHE